MPNSNNFNLKKIIPFIVSVVVIIFLIILGVKLMKKSNTQDENAVTRYEWIEMLGEMSGINEYDSNSPYFEDVDTGNPYFKYVQSAVEWGVLDESSSFAGNSYASGQFIALTAMRTIGDDKIQIYLGTEEDIGDQNYIELAIKNEFVSEKDLKRRFTQEECSHLLEKLYDLYFGTFWQDNYSEVIYQDGVIELSSEDVLQSNVDYSKIMVTSQIVDSLETGAIIVFEQENTKLKIARKVEEISADGTLTHSFVELNEVVESLVVSDVTELTFEDIVNYYGLEENVDAVSNLKYQHMNENMINTKVFPFEKSNKGFKISLSTEGENEERHLEIKVTDNATGVSYTLPVTDKVDSDSNYSIDIDIDKMILGGQIDFTLAEGVKSADVGIDVHATFNGKIQGKNEKKIPLFKTPVPLGSGIVGVDIQIFIVLSADGGISFEAELPLQASVYYEKNRGLRNYKHEISVENPTIEANCEAGTMLRLEPTLIVLGIDMMDIETDVGVTTSAKVTTRPNSQICADISLSFPIITLSICGDDDADTIIGNLGLSAEWKIATSENALVQEGLHYELLPEGKTQFVDECTYNKDGEKEKINKMAEDDNNQSEFTDLSRFYGYKLLLGFISPSTENENGKYTYSITDKGDYYLLEGTLICPEYVESWITSMGSGEHFVTGSGHGYTVVGTESYNNDQRERMILLGDDRKTYEITNLPAFDLYMGTPYNEIVSEDENGYTRYMTVFENVKLRIDKDIQIPYEIELEDGDGEIEYDIAYMSCEEWIETKLARLNVLDSNNMVHSDYFVEFSLSFSEDGMISIHGLTDLLLDYIDDLYSNVERKANFEMEVWQGSLD